MTNEAHIRECRAVEAATLGATCPKCQAKPGDRCRGSRRGAQRQFHVDRYVAGRAAMAATVTKKANTPADFVLRSLRKAVEIRLRTPDPRGSDHVAAMTDVSVELLTATTRAQVPPERQTVTVLATFYGGHVDRWHLGIPEPVGHLQTILTGTDEEGLRACFGVS